MRPTIARITPKKFELVPGLKPGARAIQPQRVPQIKEFFERAPREKAFVTFIKTEKEAIIPAGAPLRRLRTETFIKFEGRRIPIQEFEIVKGIKLPKKVPTEIKKRMLTAKELSESLSRRRIRERALFDPSRIIGAPSRARRIKPVSRARIPPMISRPRIPPTRRHIDIPSRIISPPSSRPSFSNIYRGYIKYF